MVSTEDILTACLRWWALYVSGYRQNELEEIKIKMEFLSRKGGKRLEQWVIIELHLGYL